MDLAQMYGKMTGPQVITSNVSEGGGLGGAIAGGIGAIIPYYLMEKMKQEYKDEQQLTWQQLLQLAQYLGFIPIGAAGGGGAGALGAAMPQLNLSPQYDSIANSATPNSLLSLFSNFNLANK